MEIAIIHFSDIHLKETHNVITNRVDKIFDAVKNVISKKGELFIATSGDIAFSGKQGEYLVASAFYKALAEKMSIYIGLRPNFLFVPGNHDCFLNPAFMQVRTIVLKQILETGFDDLSEQTLKVCCEPEEEYFIFANEMESQSPSKGDTVFDHPLLKIITFKVDGHVLKFNLYNTAWGSQLKEQHGSLKFPIEYVQEMVPSIPNLITVSIAHHPFQWHNPQSSTRFREALAQTSGIIITGHEHQDNKSIFTDFNEEYKTIHIESGALQSNENARISEFNLIRINLDTLDLQVQHYTYKDGEYQQASDGNIKKIARDRKLKSRPFILKQEFLNDLQNPGAAFSHPTADNIHLADLYTNPIFNKILFISGKTKRINNYCQSDSALDIEKRTGPFFRLILGNESSGKTSILKYHFLRYYNKGYYPIFISGESINEIAEEKIKAFILKSFKAQYIENEGRFSMIDFNKVVLLVDDFHKFKYKQGKPALVNNLTSIFPNIILTGNDLMAFESYTNKDKRCINLYESFEIFLIQECNPTQRDILIQKWYRLGIDYMD